MFVLEVPAGTEKGTMTCTRKQIKKGAFDHVLEEVLGSGADDRVSVALKQNNCEDISHLTSLDPLTVAPDLKQIKDTNESVLSSSDIGMLQCFICLL